jgi:ureidoglycolate hydrolase
MGWLSMSKIAQVQLHPLTPQEYEPFGWVLGPAPPVSEETECVDELASIYWNAHDFHPGEGGVVEFAWSIYKLRPFSVVVLECHRLTEQAFIPIGGFPLGHVVCPPPEDPSAGAVAPDLGRVKAFLLDGSTGVCMRRACWHTNFPLVDGTTYLVVTRRSTQVELVREHYQGGPLQETARCRIESLMSTPIQLTL